MIKCFPPCCSWKISISEVLGLRMVHFDRTGPTEKSGPPRKVDRFFRNFSSWAEPIHSVLDRNFRKFWLNGSRPLFPGALFLVLDFSSPEFFSRPFRLSLPPLTAPGSPRMRRTVLYTAVKRRSMRNALVPGRRPRKFPAPKFN